jgi:hypothetical protein
MIDQSALIDDVLGQVIELEGRPRQLVDAVTPSGQIVVTVNLNYLLEHYTEDEVWTALRRLKEIFR